MSNVPIPPQPQYINLEYFYARFFTLVEKIIVTIFQIIKKILDMDIRIASILWMSFLSAGSIMVLFKIYKLKKSYTEKYLTYKIDGEKKLEAKSRSEEWDKIKAHLSVENSIEWKMAIIEADALIDKIMIKSGYKGENLGERLKNIESSDFGNLQNIWEAHKVRNMLAHESGATRLTKMQAEDAIAKYEKALKELNFL